MNFRFRYTRAGGHTHVTLFVSNGTEETSHANAGSLCLDNEQWEELRDIIETGDMGSQRTVQFVEHK
jgi:hypothetical protein